MCASNNWVFYDGSLFLTSTTIPPAARYWHEYSTLTWMSIYGSWVWCILLQIFFLYLSAAVTKYKWPRTWSPPTSEPAEFHTAAPPSEKWISCQSLQVVRQWCPSTAIALYAQQGDQCGWTWTPSVEVWQYKIFAKMVQFKEWAAGIKVHGDGPEGGFVCYPVFPDPLTGGKSYLAVQQNPNSQIGGES